MRKITLFKLMLIIFSIAFGAHAFGQAVFTSAATGSWNDPTSWTLNSGSDEDGIPDADDDVTIMNTHIISIPAETTVNCNNITVAGGSATSISMIGENSILNIHGSLSATTAPTAGNFIDCTAHVTAKAIFKRSTSGALITGTWGTFGEKARVEIDLPTDVIGSVTVAVKFRELIVKSGTFSTTGEIRPDEGTANTGKVTIEDGATLLTTSRFSRTGTTNTPFGSLTINGTGKIIFNGTTTFSLPAVASGFPVYTFSPEAQIEYQGGTQTIGDINYPNLIINATTAGTAKTWSPSGNRTATSITVTQGIFAYGNGVVCTVAGNISVASTGTIAPGSSANRFVASGSNRTFTLNGTARVTANETQTAAATTPFSYQYNGFTTYTFAPTSWISFRSPTTAPVTQGVDGITGSPFGNVEIAAISNLTAAGSNTHTFKSDVVIVGTLAFPRLGANTSLIINFGANTVKVGGAIQLNGSNTSSQSGGRTYNMGTSTIELNGTTAQNTLGGNDLPTTFNNLTINNTAGITPQSAISVNGTLTLTNGQVTLGNNNFTAGALSGGSATSYVVTNGTGKLSVSAGAATKVTIPVGTTTDYNVLSLTPTDATVFTVSVLNGVPEAASSNIRFSDYTWNIESATPSATELEITPATAVSNGISSFIARWNGTAYDYQTAIRTGDTYKATINTFSSFVVGETDNTTNLSDLNENVKIYSSELSIKIDGIANGSNIRITNINGQTLVSQKALTTENTFSVKSGIYLVTIEINGKMSTKKVLVK